MVDSRVLLGAGMLSLALVGGATWVLLDPDRATEMVETALPGPVETEPEPDEAAREREDRRAAARNLAGMQRRDDEPADPADASYGSGAIDRATASAGFDHVMAEVEAIGKARTRLEREEWDTLYRSANDAFAAYSMHLNANDPADLDELDRAHDRLQKALRRVRVRGRKFGD